MRQARGRSGPGPVSGSDPDVLLVADDRGELVDDDARPSDERAVDIGLAQATRDFPRLQRAAVEGAGACCRAVPLELAWINLEGTFAPEGTFTPEGTFSDESTGEPDDWV